MKASVDWFAGIIRLHEDGVEIPGEYIWFSCITREGADGKTVRIHGALNAPKSIRAIKEKFREEGFKTAIFDRLLPDGSFKSIEVKL